MTNPALLLIHLLATTYMMGLIWFVQVVHYPLYPHVGDEAMVAYQARHMRWTTWVVLPPMVIELALAALLPFMLTDPAQRVLAWVGLVLVIGVWVSTFTLQVPAHAILEKGPDAAAARKLVLTNWLRTIGWTLRTGIAAWLVYAHMRPAGAGGAAG